MKCPNCKNEIPSHHEEVECGMCNGEGGKLVEADQVRVGCIWCESTGTVTEEYPDNPDCMYCDYNFEID